MRRAILDVFYSRVHDNDVAQALDRLAMDESVELETRISAVLCLVSGVYAEYAKRRWTASREPLKQQYKEAITKHAPRVL